MKRIPSLPRAALNVLAFMQSDTLRRNSSRSLRRGWAATFLLGLGVFSITGCVGTHEVPTSGPGHPANAESEFFAFSPPGNPFSHAVAPVNAPEPSDANDETDRMPDMNHEHSASPNGVGLTIYSCPMHADVRSDRPGTCPKCGMQLVPSKASPPSHDHGGAA